MGACTTLDEEDPQDSYGEEDDDDEEDGCGSATTTTTSSAGGSSLGQESGGKQDGAAVVTTDLAHRHPSLAIPAVAGPASLHRRPRSPAAEAPPVSAPPRRRQQQVRGVEEEEGRGRHQVVDHGEQPFAAQKRRAKGEAAGRTSKKRKVEKDDKYARVVLTRNRGEDREAREDMFESPESLFCQWLALECFADAIFVCSSWHSGLGQVVFGSSSRRKVDCMVAVDELVLLPQEPEVETEDGWELPPRETKTVRHLHHFNLDGRWWHRAKGECKPDCPRGARTRERREKKERELAAAAGEEQDGAQDDDDDEDGALPPEQARRVAAALAGTGPADHDDDGHLPEVLLGDDEGAEVLDGRRQRRQAWHEARQERQEADDAVENAMRVAYAEALTAVSPSRLRFTFRSYAECDIFHQEHPPDPDSMRAEDSVKWDSVRREAEAARERTRREWRAGGGRASAPPSSERPPPGSKKSVGGVGETCRMTHRDFASVRDLLKTKHADGVLLGFRTRRIRQDNLVKKILAAGFNSVRGQEMGGFIVIEVGFQKRLQNAPLLKCVLVSLAGGVTALVTEAAARFDGELSHLGRRRDEGRRWSAAWPVFLPPPARWSHTSTAGQIHADAVAHALGQVGRPQGRAVCRREARGGRGQARDAVQGQVSRQGHYSDAGLFSVSVAPACSCCCCCQRGRLCRFLVLERGLKNFRVRHYCHFVAKHWLTPYIDNLVQRRHDLKQLGEAPILSALLKILFNGV